LKMPRKGKGGERFLEGEKKREKFVGTRSG